VFLSEQNVYLLTHRLYNLLIQEGNKVRYNDIRNVIPVYLNAFLKTRDLRDYQVVNYQASDNINWVHILDTINNDFEKHCDKYIEWNTFNPYRMWLKVGSYQNQTQKRMRELTADDIPTIDLCSERPMVRKNNIFRYNNQIPVWQRSMNTRHYDKSNDGLRNNTADRASLETPIRGYDMSDIHGLIGKWKKEDWYGFS
jgi:hypothetical protein